MNSHLGVFDLGDLVEIRAHEVGALMRSSRKCLHRESDEMDLLSAPLDPPNKTTHRQVGLFVWVLRA